jgi:Inositol phospholipid synthesis and fat-storage-inducing TM
MAIMHVGKKTLFYDTNLKVALYLGSLFLISLIGDFVPFPKTYFARSDNLFNVYFVKLGWAWTLLFTTPFVFMTSITLCCGDRQKFLRFHLPRIVIATVFWFVWTKFFNYIEFSFGRCSYRGFDSKPSCLKAGHLWNGFDISGHAFILIHSSLVMIEEARAIIGWEYIKDHLRNEEHNRNTKDSSETRNPLRNLSDEELKALKFLYTRFTPVIRLLFVGMAALQLLWDVMLVCTMLYYHRMVEKFVSGVIAIFTWYFAYRVWYPAPLYLPHPVGRGLFNYAKEKTDAMPLRRKSSLLSNHSHSAANKVPKFMGMPIYPGGMPQQQQAQGGQASAQQAASNESFGQTEGPGFSKFEAFQGPSTSSYRMKY